MNLELTESVKEILEKVRVLTGKEIKFVERNDMTEYAALKAARKHMPFHLILYKTEHDKLINHLIAHECGHLLRIFNVPENKRLIPMTNDQLKLKALTEIEPEIEKLSSNLPFDALTQIVNMWYMGIVRQLTNHPPDIMIEKWIYDEYPELRPYQSQSIWKQHSESIGGLSREVMKMTPRKIMHSSNVMNYAFFRVLGLHFQVNYIRPYKKSPFVDDGKELAAMIQDYSDNYEGDIEMINRWAEFLDLSNWFSWKNFEDIPENYEDMM